MLIEFQVQNYRSFKERQTFSMVAASFADQREENTFDAGLKGFGRFLRSAVVYGPNAAGKTNLLRAIQFVKNMVVTSATVGLNAKYPYTPFKFSNATREAPSEFQITFAQGGIRYEYGFTMRPKRIEREWLIEHVPSKSRTRGRMMFDRTWNAKGQKYDWKFSSFLKGQRSVWSESTRPDALFLSTAIQLNSAQLKPVFEWFQSRLVVITGAIKMNRSLTLKLLREPSGKAKILPFLREADLGISDLNVERETVTSGGVVFAGNPLIEAQEGGDMNLLKVTLSHMTDEPNVPAEIDFSEESSGTQILFNTAGAWLNVIEKGEVLLFDEIDTNMHPHLLRFLIEKFHSKLTNPNNAQLICSTHNTVLLDQDLFRRDQIWFVEKQKNGASRLYPLTDFRPRNDEVVERWYLRGRYGALPVLPEVASE